MNAILALLAHVAPEHWLILGLALLIAEMASGTTYLLWPAVAAFVTACVAWIAPTDWIAEMAIFAVLVVALTAFGRPIVRRWRSEGAASGLNERATALIGVHAVVTEFANGVGSVQVQDTIWRAVSDEALGAGQAVVVAGVSGATLTVKRAH
jgi:hypothetical protein